MVGYGTFCAGMDAQFGTAVAPLQLRLSIRPAQRRFRRVRCHAGLSIVVRNARTDRNAAKRQQIFDCMTEPRTTELIHESVLNYCRGDPVWQATDISVNKATRTLSCMPIRRRKCGTR
jgi:hypothetical protein